MIILFRSSVYTGPSEPRKTGDWIGVNPTLVTSVTPIKDGHARIHFDCDNSVYVADPVDKTVIRLNDGLKRL